MITIVGAGALGSHVALLLRNENAGLKVIDFDRVETKNTQSQFHSIMSLGRNKAQSLKQAFQGLFGVDIVALPYKLADTNAQVGLKDSRLVIDCTDNIEARKVITKACKEMNIPLLHGALAASGDFARIVWEEHFIPDAESGDTAATCVDGAHLAFHVLSSAYLASEAQSFLRTKKKRSWQITPTSLVRLA